MKQKEVVVPGYTQEELLALDRRVRFQLIRKAQGLCISCSKRPIEKQRSKGLCSECLQTQCERVKRTYREKKEAQNANSATRNSEGATVVVRDPEPAAPSGVSAAPIETGIGK